MVIITSSPRRIVVKQMSDMTLTQQHRLQKMLAIAL